jgi:hypothetical protein
LSDQPLCTPAINYLHRLARRTEQLCLLNKILKREKAKMEEIIASEERQENEVVVILKGQHIVSGAEIRAIERLVQAKKKGSKKKNTELVIKFAD